MALLTVVWLGYVRFNHPRYHMGGPVWEALWNKFMWPGTIGIVLAALGLMQNSRVRVLSFVAIVIIVLAYVLLTPPMAFA